MIYYQDKTASLMPKSREIICEKKTEYPHTGQYIDAIAEGSYLCRRCGLALFRANSQFTSSCGWPSFDANIADNVKFIQDADGHRMEILCDRCLGHLGHVFQGEGYTSNNTRYCVNSASLDFVPDSDVSDTQELIVAGGCFWGVDYYLRRIPGVLNVEVGYCGGIMQHPTYEDVCTGKTGHYEAVRVLFDSDKTDDHTVLKRFFEIHDPTQTQGQGPDKGTQYQSAVFYHTKDQHNVAASLIEQLENKGYHVATSLLPAGIFWPAEAYHQDYYTKHTKIPYCHQPVDRF